ncbi:MAG: LPS export ABC transporter permease LptG [Alphaproteobacteria bacterium]
MRVIDRYFTRLFLARFLLLLFGIVSLMSLLDFLAQGDSVVADAGEAPLATVARYTVLRLPEIVSRSIPFAVLLATLVTLSGMQRQSELTALKSFGVSQLRMMTALAPVAVLIAVPQFWIDSAVMPSSVAALRDWGVGDYKTAATRDEAGLTWARQGGDVVRFRSAGPDGLTDVTIFRRNEAGRLAEQIDAARARPGPDGWLLADVRVVRPGTSGVERHERLEWAGGPDRALLRSLSVYPRELSFQELLRLARAPDTGSSPPYLYAFWLHKKLAMPVATVLIVFLSVPLVQGFDRRGGAALVIAAGIALGFVFFSFDGIVVALGEAGLVPPALAAWAPTLAFAAIAASIALRHETL